MFQQFPTRRQIIDGILKAEQRQIFRQKKAQSVDRRNKTLMVRQNAWKIFFSASGIHQSDFLDDEIDREGLCDPDDPLTLALLKMFSMETFLQMELNKASNKEDITMVDTLGPLSAVMNQIVIGNNLDQSSFRDSLVS